MKRKLSLLFGILLLVLLTLLCTSCGKSVTKVYVYNWGEYMPLGKYGSENIMRAFEEYYNETHEEEIRVVYSIYASNEDMYAKLKTGSSKVDLIFPSDYMAARLIAEDMLTPLDYASIPNYKYIAPQFRNSAEGVGDGPSYDPYCRYTVPYTYGVVGLIYDTKAVEETPDSWSILWDERYAGMILNFNNNRDAFGIAQYLLGYEHGATSEENNYVNTSDKARWDEALELLQAQRPVLQAYAMDEVFNKMESGAAALAPYYVGDFYTMQENNPDLAFVIPKEGTNIFVDAMCIPKQSQNKEIAEALINFLLEPEIALEIAEYICYPSPNTAVTENEDYEYYRDEILYPDTEGMTLYYFENLDTETLQYANGLWERLKVESSSGTGIYVFAGIIVGGLFLFLLISAWKKKKRQKYY